MFNLQYMTAIYPHLLKPHPKNSESGTEDDDDETSFVDMPEFPTDLCCHSDKMPAGSTPPPPDVAMEEGIPLRLRNMFISKAIFKRIQGIATGYKEFKTLRQVSKEMECTIGIESISAQ